MLHGSTGDAAQSMSILRKYADDHNFILYAPPSTTYTWDLVNPGRYEKDVVQINNGLDLMFRNFNLDTAKIAIAGFSDGASYALSLGLTNGDLFTHVIAFSPGFIRFKNATGKPKIFISHGEDDTVLSIGLSRAIVEQLNSRSFELNYVEFSGTHGVPGDISRTAIDWFKK
jgi:predicted esterase